MCVRFVVSRCNAVQSSAEVCDARKCVYFVYNSTKDATSNKREKMTCVKSLLSETSPCPTDWIGLHESNGMPASIQTGPMHPNNVCRPVVDTVLDSSSYWHRYAVILGVPTNRCYVSQSVPDKMNSTMTNRLVQPNLSRFDMTGCVMWVGSAMACDGAMTW